LPAISKRVKYKGREAFDFVYSANIFEHLDDLSKCLDESKRQFFTSDGKRKPMPE